ncbi:MAG: hypothetical protein KGJ13_06710 [Patescibacteria group bacterium]|nr:hypothetical protein [Patescibacteria group bacterium]
MKKRLPWFVGTIGAILFFGYYETQAFIHPDHYATLSNTVATIGHAWPISIFFMGQFSGILAAHFFWPWKANPEGEGGG